METYNSEEEQIEALKKWWQANSSSVISGIFAGIVLIGGWNIWGSYQQDQAKKASVLYDQMLVAVKENRIEAADKIISQLERQYGSSPYASYAALFQAKLKVQQGDLDAARLILQKTVATNDAEIQNVARIRLIQLLLALGEFEQGLQIIAEVDQSSMQAFNGYYEELKGDLYLALDRIGEARTAFQNAIREGQTSPLLQMKIDDLTAPEINTDNK